MGLVLILILSLGVGKAIIDPVKKTKDDVSVCERDSRCDSSCVSTNACTLDGDD